MLCDSNYPSGSAIGCTSTQWQTFVRELKHGAGGLTGVWRKSSRSANSECVEVAEFGGARVAVRDSKTSGPMLVVPDAGWRSFLAGVKAGGFGG
ncbi:hypothetical protein Sru01_13400 [Sphaerisporangium rufum]|uniref:DUF397 domain-containing protein n=2 Tax=Sphaerisporangium rufum TaxID=1381558 RepID=A0A919QZT2_9ACTN|nr:hypothetical protein Sru01_13400 [Sphaerisporangium rufum]